METISFKKTNKYSLIIVLMFLISCQKSELGVRLGDHVLTKGLYYKGHFPGGITNIQELDIESEPEKEIIIFGAQNYVILNAETRKEVKSINVKECIGSRPEIVRAQEGGSPAIMMGGGGFGDVGLTNENGDYIWKYHHVFGASPSMTAGDLDKDQKLEFYVTDFDGLRKLDYSGRQIWRSDKKSWERDIQIYSPSASQTPLILTRGDDGNIRFWDKAGRLAKEVTPEAKIYGLELLSWPDRHNILTNTVNEIIVMGLDGKIILRYKLGRNSLDLYFTIKILDIRGVPVRFEPQSKPYLAVITDFSVPKNRAMLSVFSADRELVYQEMIYSTTGINIIDNPDGSESLLVGGGAENVWIYQRRFGQISGQIRKGSG